MFVIKEPGNQNFEKFGIKGKIFPSSGLTAKMSFVLIETQTGHETVILQRECDFCYYVLEGSGCFEINGARRMRGGGFGSDPGRE